MVGNVIIQADNPPMSNKTDRFFPFIYLPFPLFVPLLPPLGGLLPRPPPDEFPVLLGQLGFVLLAIVDFLLKDKIEIAFWQFDFILQAG